ncbi:hypothetical protein BC941DRAFT_407189 [Chlamydoabsidia padenii]|nr:hypothetical protein BC941DRAFT_407189 [Chlamydoabsidia padenii]
MTPWISARTLCHLTKVAWTRITHTKHTCGHILLLLTSTAICLILQGITAGLHSQALSTLLDLYVQSGGDVSLLTSPLNWNQTQESNPHLLALVDLKRLKDENIFFVLLRIFYVYLGIDAIVRQSVIQLVAHAGLEFTSVVFAAAQLYETHICKDLAKSSMDVGVFDSAIHMSIAVIVILSVFTLILAYSCKIIQQEIGWSTYKRLGADQGQKERYRLAQWFLLVLKLDAFFHLVFLVFFVVVMSQEQIYGRGGAGMVWYIFHLIVTLLQIPAILIARRGVTHEHSTCMNIFILLELVFLVDFCIILQQTATSWIYWALAVCFTILLCITTVILTIYVKRNFNMGLLIHMQHLYNDDDIFKNGHKLGATSTRNSWLIDDDDMDHDFVAATRTTVTATTVTGMTSTTTGQSISIVKTEDSNKASVESNNLQQYR